MRLEVELQGTEMTFGKMLNVNFGAYVSGGSGDMPSLSAHASSDHSISLVYNGNTIVSNLATKAYIDQLNLGSGPADPGGGGDSLFLSVFDIVYGPDGETPISIKAKYDFWGVGSVAAGAPGEGGSVNPGDPGQGGSQVSWGATESNYVSLSVDSEVKTLALQGHEHDYSSQFAATQHEHPEYRKTTDNVFQNSIAIKNGENTAYIAVDSEGRLYVDVDFYTLKSLSAGAPGHVEEGTGGESGTTVEWAESSTAGYGLLRVGAEDVGGTLIALSDHTHSGYVPTTRTINTKALTEDISLTASDVGAASSTHNHDGLYSYGNIITYPTIPSMITLLFKQHKSDLLFMQHNLPLYESTRLKSSGDFTNINAGISVKKITLKYSDTVSTELKIDKNGNVYVDGNFYATGSIAAGASGSTPVYATPSYVDSAIEDAMSGYEPINLEAYATKNYVQDAISGLGSGGSGTVVSWGEEITGESVSLDVVGTSKSVSLSGHTHGSFTESVLFYGAIIGTSATFLNSLKAKDFTFQDGPLDTKPVSITKDTDGNIVVNGNLYATGSLSAGGAGILGLVQAVRAGSITGAGAITNIIGQCTVSLTNTEYVITHNLGKANYVCSPVMKDPASAIKMYVKNKTDNTVTVVFTDGSGAKVTNDFDFVIL